MDEDSYTLVSFEQLKHSFLMAVNSLQVHSNIFTLAFSKRITPANIAFQRTRRVAPGFNKLRKSLQNLKFQRKTML
jgi:hypothetical protein